MSSQEAVPDSGGPQAMPGQLLRETREGLGLTVSEVSGVIKFSPRQIEALERDDFSQLEGKTFLRGFVRAYARLLKLAPEPLLAMLDAEELPTQELVIPPENMGETDPKPFYRVHLKKLLVLLVALIAIAAASVFKGEIEKYRASMGVAATSAPTSDQTAPKQEAVASSSEAVPVASPDLATTEVAISATTVAPAAAVSSAAAEPASILTPQGLVFVFSDLSWLEVKDANGRTLITGEFPGGQTQTISGKPPYQVWIGKSSAVKVTYQGQPVDTQPFTREDVARLTLGH